MKSNNIKITINEKEIPLENIEDTDIEILYQPKTYIESCTINGKNGHNFYSAYMGDILVGEFEVEPDSELDKHFKKAYDNHTYVEINED